MAPEKETSSGESKWLEYTLYAAALGFVLIAVYQLVSTHRIVLLQRDTYPSSQEAATEEEPAADDAGA